MAIMVGVLVFIFLGVLFLLWLLLRERDRCTELQQSFENYKRQQAELHEDIGYLQAEADTVKNKLIQADLNLGTKEDHLEQLNEEITRTEKQYQNISKQYQDMDEKFTFFIHHITNTREEFKKTQNEAMAAYCDTLEVAYTEKENWYDQRILALEKAYNDKHKQLEQEAEEYTKLIDKIKKSLWAVTEAQKQAEAVTANKEHYQLKINQTDEEDIHILNNIKPSLKNPRILSMLIWSTFYKKPMDELCVNVLGINTVCGIYKITNQFNNKCYIGQAVDVAKRWKDHAKCGLGIDTPSNNKLYRAMQISGLPNFTWELLEKCSKEELNEREKFYIELYSAKEYGYNSTSGNST